MPLFSYYYYYYYYYHYYNIMIIIDIHMYFLLLFNCLDSLHSRCKGDIILFRNKVSSLCNEVYFLLMTNRRRAD